MSAMLEACRDMPVIEMPAGEVVLAQDDNVSALLVLKRGRVDIIRDGVTIAVVTEPGSVLGEMAILLQQHHSATAKTSEDSEFYMADDGLGFLESNPKVALELARLLASRVNVVNRYLVEARGDAERAEIRMIDALQDLMYADKAPRNYKFKDEEAK